MTHSELTCTISFSRIMNSSVIKVKRAEPNKFIPMPHQRQPSTKKRSGNGRGGFLFSLNECRLRINPPSETKRKDMGNGILDTGYWILDPGKRTSR